MAIRQANLALLLFLCLPQAQAGAILDGPNRRITDSGLVRYSEAEMPALAVQGDSLYATWVDDRFNSHSSVFFARSDDRGDTWSENILVSALPYDDWTENPKIAIQPDGTLWVAWYLFHGDASDIDNDLRIARSTNNGETWELYTLMDGTGHEDLWKPRIAADANNVYVFFHDYKNLDGDAGYNLMLYRINADTLEVSATQVNDAPRSGRVTNELQDDGPQLDFAFVDMNETSLMCAAWEDTRNRFAILGACSTDRGQTFSDNFAISGQDAIDPDIAIDKDGTLYATYSLDIDGDNNILLRYSTDQGQSWSDPKPVTQLEHGKVKDKELAVDAKGQLIIPWVQRFPGGWGSSNDLNLSTSSDGGNHFATLWDIEDDQGKHPNIAAKSDLAIAIGPGEGLDAYAYLAWQDTRNPEDEIWFSRAILDGTPPTQPKQLSARSGDTVVKLNWQASSDGNGVQGYYILRAESESGPYTRITPRPVQANRYTDVGLDPVERHYYQVVAIDGTGNLSDPSEPVSESATAATDLPGGTLVFDHNKVMHLQPLSGGNGQTLTDAEKPVLAVDGTRLYYQSGETVERRSISREGRLGSAETFITREGMFDFDIAADNLHFAVINIREQFNTDLGICFVAEPTFATPSQDLYTDQYNDSSKVSISADHHWMAYRYDGFCNGLAYGNTYPGDFCIANLNTQESDCVEGANIKGSDFAPSGHDIVFASDVGGQHEIWKAKVSSEGELINFTQLTRGAQNQPADNPRWSSDGQWIVYQRDLNPDSDEEATDWRLFAVRADGTSHRDLGRAGEHPALLSEQSIGGNGSSSGSGGKKGGGLGPLGLAFLGWLLVVRRRM